MNSEVFGPHILRVPLQETFDTVVTHLMRQGQKSTSPDGTCAYHGRDGLQCAAGCLIPDEIYAPNMEGSTWGFLHEVSPGIKPLGHDRWLVSCLQDTHDNVPTWEWADELRKIARQYNLTLPPCLTEKE